MVTRVATPGPVTGLLRPPVTPTTWLAKLSSGCDLGGPAYWSLPSLPMSLLLLCSPLTGPSSLPGCPPPVSAWLFLLGAQVQLQVPPPPPSRSPSLSHCPVISGPDALHAPPHSPTVSDELASSLVICSLSRPPDCEREGATWIQSPCFPR